MANTPTLNTTSVDYDPFASPAIARTAPSTEAQREIWLATRNGTEASLAFNESVSYRLRGELDLPAMRAALQGLIDRHDALRCTFSVDGLTLCLATSLALPVPLTDLSGMSAAERERRLAERLAAHVDEPFDLEHGPLVRAEIVRRDTRDHLVILTAHHIVCDGWSFWVLTKDLAAFYSARSHERTPVLARAESFAEFAAGEAGRGRTAETMADEAYWLSRFSDDIPVLELPTDRPHPPFKTYASEREDYLLDAALVEQVKKTGARAGASFFTTLLATFNVLLHRLSGQSDLVVGIPAAGQSVGGHDALVGHCVNVLPLRTRLEPKTRFDELLKAVRTTMLDAYEHQQYTYGTLLQKLPIDRDPSRLPLVSVIFNIDQALAGEARRFEGLDFEFTSNPRHYENFDLFVNAMETGGALWLECQYNSDLLDRATLRRWLGAFESLLRAFAEDPARGVAQAPLLGQGERELLRSWNATDMDFPETSCVHELIVEQAARAPERVAVVGEGRSLTYGELDSRSNQLARRLRAAGVRRDSLVGLCLERTPDLLVGLLGILKAGGGYVPLDPGFPTDRLQFMVEDSRMKLLVIESGLRDRFPAGAVATLILDEEWEKVALESGAPLDRDGASAAPESVAYVIYTSGSTGRPKGVVVPHRSLVNLVTSVRQTPGMNESDVVLAVTTFSFDIAVSEVILPLVVGASVVLVGRDVAADGERLREAIERRGVTFIDATPATWRLLLASGWPGDRRIKGICTGEAMPKDLALALIDRLGSLWNGYGPTETTVWSTFHEVKKPLGRILIGRPLGNTQIHVLDAHHEPVPVGAVGELWIGGAGVTRGYLNRPELTAERFISDPFHPAPGARLYRTGDLARYQADGNLECLGRNDFQVKVRGYRIELGEIETALATDASIAQAVVTAREDRPGDVRLVAYLVPRAGARIESESLRHQLSGRLPEYMIPSHFVALDSLPLLPNGKINRQALPAPGLLALEPAAGYVLPRTDLERVLAAAWQEALAVPRVSVHDDFFRLGGHSLLAAQMVARLARDHRLVVPLRSVFENSTVASMAAALGDVRKEEGARPGIPRREDQTQAPLSLMQQRLWFLEQYDPGRVVHNVPSAHRLRGPLDLPALERAFRELVRRQSALRTVVGEEDGTAVQVVLPQVQVNLVLEDFSALPRVEAEKAVAKRMEEELVLPFDLASGPLFRLRLFRTADREHILFFMAHHLVFDGWSFDLLYEEISALYEAYTHGEPAALPELPVTYGDFAAWHREWMQGAELERQLAYWMESLRGGIAPLDLPSDRPRPPVMSGGGDTIWIEIGEARLSALGVVAQKAGATLFMTLLAAFQAFLHRYTGETDFNVGTPVRGRSWPEVERIMGFFVNALVLRARVDPAESFLDLLGSVRQRTLEAFDHQDVPFERLIQDLNVPRDESRTPLYQVWFSFQDVRSRPRGWGSLGHENIPIFPPTTAQDLGLWFLRTSEKLVGGLNYNTDLFDRATMVRFFDEFQEFLAAISETPEQSVGTLRVLPAEELGRLRACNATDMFYARDLGVHDLVSAQAARTPDRTALEFEGRTQSYAELEAGSNRLARRLRAMGAQRGSLVGLAVERGPEMVTALLGILKAGAAYVPLDPGFPRERLSFMVADSGMKVLVTTATLQDDLALPVERVLLLDKEQGETLEESAEPLPRDAHSAESDDRAYVIYTSGSTGKPKGVEVPHRAVVNFLTSMRERPGFTEADRMVAVTTLSFDIAVLELQLPLTVGATVVLASRDTATDGDRLGNLLRESQATVMQATPATWRLLLEAGWHGGPGFKVLVGGEALPRELAEELAKRAGSVWNMYGPTETTVWSTCWRVESPVVGSILIGTPIGNTQAHVLDPERQPVPTGVPGELWIGGDGVSLGYLNRPDLTSERFLDDPFRRVPGAKLYRTGDLARWRADGNLEALGRTDFQVKVRGYRIELGEIESLLARHEGVAHAAVVARPGPGGENRLVAYVVGRDGKVPSSAELRKMLRRELPDYMIPSAFVALDEFPLTPNAKVDRRALPDPEELRGEPVVASVPPRTSTEMLLADVWRELLGVSQVAVHDHFFDLGGHSLLIMRALAAMEKKIGKRLNPREYIFQNLEQIAQAYDRAPSTSPEAPGLGRRILGSLSGALSRRRDGPA